MTPIHFGPPARRLFGLLHPAEAPSGPPSAVLICPPFGQEAIRSHRLERILAERLARSGHHVFRFDYYGTGDAAGADADGDMAGWSADIVTAHAELTQQAPGTPVTWFGARLGGTLAMQALQSTHRKPPAVRRLVLWDPVLEGATYAEVLRERHVASLEQRSFIPKRAWRQQLERDADSFVDEAIGFAISPALRRQLLSLRAQELTMPPQMDGRVILRTNDAVGQTWAARQAAHNAGVQMVGLNHTLDWTADPEPYAAMVPTDVVQTLLVQCRD